MINHYVYDVDRETVLDKISQLQPLNYNQFRWWRRFDSPNKTLHKYSNLLDKIQNGDYDFSHYYWQAKNAMNSARRKRLWDDFEKDEKERINGIEKDFQMKFKMSRKKVREEIEEFGGTLEDFYHYCDKQFGTRQEKIPTRGRPRKVI